MRHQLSIVSLRVIAITTGLAVFVSCTAKNSAIDDNDASRAAGVFPADPRTSKRARPVLPNQNVGVFTGINEFRRESGVRTLLFCVNDAVEQAHLFVLELGLIPPENCFLCLKGEPSDELTRKHLRELIKAGVIPIGDNVPIGDNADRDSILSALIEASRIPLGPENLMLVSISSHGFEDNGHGYVIPSDGRGYKYPTTDLDVGTIAGILGDSKAGNRLLILDACRQTAPNGIKGNDPGMSNSFRSALQPAKGQVVLASCDAGQLSFEDIDLCHGVFTSYLLKALRGEVQWDANGFITLGKVTDFLDQMTDWEVNNIANITPAQAQHPWISGPLSAQKIVLADRRKRSNADVTEIIESLPGKIDNQGFNSTLCARIIDVLKKGRQSAEIDRDLLAECKAFIGGTMKSMEFVSYVRRNVPTGNLKSPDPTPVLVPLPPVDKGIIPH